MYYKQTEGKNLIHHNVYHPGPKNWKRLQCFKIDLLY